MYDINELLAKKLFWAKKNGRDTLMYVSPCLGLAGTLDGINLPWFPIHYEKELKQLGVPYEIYGDQCLIHDPDVEEYRDITEPLMTVVDGKVKQIFTSPVKYTGKIPTNNMLEAAYSYYEKVWEDLKQLVLPKEQKLFDEYFEKNSKDGIVYWVNNLGFTSILSVSDLFSGKWGAKYYQIPLQHGSYNYIVISKATFKGQSRITLKVPEWYVGQLIGFRGENAKKLAHELGVGYVKIEAES